MVKLRMNQDLVDCCWPQCRGEEVVLSKTVLSNFRPKQANEWIGGPGGSIIELFIAILT